MYKSFPFQRIFLVKVYYSRTKPVQSKVSLKLGEIEIMLLTYVENERQQVFFVCRKTLNTAYEIFQMVKSWKLFLWTLQLIRFLFKPFLNFSNNFITFEIDLVDTR